MQHITRTDLIAFRFRCPIGRAAVDRGAVEQADGLRRTRRYALRLSATFLPAAFLHLFGDLNMVKGEPVAAR